MAAVARDMSAGGSSRRLAEVTRGPRPGEREAREQRRLALTPHTGSRCRASSTSTAVFQWPSDPYTCTPEWVLVNSSNR